MRTKVVSGLVAVAMAVTVTVGGTARPARADTDWIDIAASVAESLFGGGGGDLERAKREIIAAINAAKQEILNHIDAIAAADVEACTESAVTKFEQIDSMPPGLLGPFVNGAVDCAYLSSSYFNTVQDLSAADNIGKLMGIIYSIAMAGFTKFGLSAVALLESLIRGYEAVVARFKPTCTNTPLWGDAPPGLGPVEVYVRCTAYNGDVGVDWVTVTARRGQPLPPVDQSRADAYATRNTSRATAMAALPKLRAAL